MRMLRKPHRIALAAPACLLLASCHSEPIMQTPATTASNSVFRLDNAQWSAPYDGPLGYPKGAQRATLSTDAVSGGETYYARFPAGSRFELHWHSHAEYAVVLQGNVIHTLGTESTAMSAGDYVIIPAKTNHGWQVDPQEDAYLMMRRDGRADFNFVER
jgi:uncharacterized cupin superfamily protein